jgi:hypothetical protein
MQRTIYHIEKRFLKEQSYELNGINCYLKAHTFKLTMRFSTKSPTMVVHINVLKQIRGLNKLETHLIPIVTHMDLLINII